MHVVKKLDHYDLIRKILKDSFNFNADCKVSISRVSQTFTQKEENIIAKMENCNKCEMYLCFKNIVAKQVYTFSH